MDRLEAPLELRDHLLIWIFVRDEIGLQVVVEPVLSVADATGQRVVYLVVTACLPVDDDGIVAVPNLLYGVLGRSLLFAQLASWVVCKEDIQSANAISWSALQLLSLLFRPLG